MNDWWKAPVLQGPENDYGQYDYLIEELPDDYVKWNFTKYPCKCDSCGKQRHLILVSVHSFYTLDGYDSMDYNECCVCRLKEKVWCIKNRIKKIIIKEVDIVKCAWMCSKKDPKRGFKYYYGVLNKIHR